jgi:hypothetical protein
MMKTTAHALPEPSEIGGGPRKIHTVTRSRKGLWRVSTSSMIRNAPNNRWLEEQGVPDMNAAAAIAVRKTREA